MFMFPFCLYYREQGKSKKAAKKEAKEDIKAARKEEKKTTTVITLKIMFQLFTYLVLY